MIEKNPIKLFLETSSRFVPDSFLYINIVAFLPKKGMVLPVFHDKIPQTYQEVQPWLQSIQSHMGNPPTTGTVAQLTAGNTY